MHEDLLGYLLGALEPQEMRQVEQALREDPELRAQLAQIERSLEPLANLQLPNDPPPVDLLARTMAMIPPIGEGIGDASASQSTGDVPVSKGQSVGLSPASEHVRTNQWRWQDLFAAATAAAIVLALILPAISEGRFESRKVACQDQLRRFGTAISQFVSRTEQQRLPAVAETGPEAFAGVYAVRLNDAGLIDDAMMRWCPSLDLPDAASLDVADLNVKARQPANLITSQVNAVDRAGAIDPAEMFIHRLSSIQDLHLASLNRLRSYQRYAGGHYAYTLGVREGESYRSPRYEQRASFAILSDAPIATGYGGNPIRPISHSGRGMNVLFEDGRVRFIMVDSMDGLPDHPWLNHRGNVEAGVTPDDATLAPSWRPPFIHSLQR